MTITTGVYVGIDVGKEQLDLAVLGETVVSQWGIDPCGIAGLVGRLRERQLELVVATRYNPVIKAFYEHLLSRGKEKKVALMACTLAPHASAGVRKFLTSLNAMLRDQKPFGYPAMA